MVAGTILNITLKLKSDIRKGIRKPKTLGKHTLYSTLIVYNERRGVCAGFVRCTGDVRSNGRPRSGRVAPAQRAGHTRGARVRARAAGGLHARSACPRRAAARVAKRR